MMLDEKKNAHHSHPSLLPLRMALSAAESGSPARPPRIDANEQCAMQLIAKVKAEYRKQQFVMNWNDIPSPHGLHADLQVTVNSNV
jgi:hypothetical protein